MTHPAKYNADKEAVTKLLNKILATEPVFFLRYKRHNFMAKVTDSESVKTEFLSHAKEDMPHADRMARRIIELGYAG